MEKGVLPIHVHVEAEITKGKYHDYDTFLGGEAVEYLKTYLETRRLGTHWMPPEAVRDDSPLIRDEHSREVRQLSEGSIHRLLHRLFVKAGLINLDDKKT